MGRTNVVQMAFSPSGVVTAWFSRKWLLSSQIIPASLTGQYTTMVRANNATASPNVRAEDMCRRVATARLQGKPGMGVRRRSVGGKARLGVVGVLTSGHD